MAPPTTRKLIQGFIWMFNHYRRMHPTSKIKMKTLGALTSQKIKFKWNKEANASFNGKKINVSA